jgi:hypothetical protein
MRTGSSSTCRTGNIAPVATPHVGERIIEQGTHDELLRLDGRHAKRWKHQTGGFLPDDVPEEPVE